MLYTTEYSPLEEKNHKERYKLLSLRKSNLLSSNLPLAYPIPSGGIIIFTMLEMNDKTTTLSPDYPASEVAGDVDVAPTAFGRDYDVAAQFLANLDPSVRGDSVSAKEARKVLWKIDLCLLPLIAGSVILSAVDKNIISNAAIYGMEKDTGLVGNDFSWVGSIFFFGYLVFEWPMAYLIQLLPVAKCFAATVLGWGIIAMCTAATQNFAGLATVRFLSRLYRASILYIADEWL